MDKYQLSNGLKLPIIGFGTWKLKNNEDTIEIIKNAVNCGYRLFDTASAYGNEEAIGKGLKISNINRKELFISGKLWNEDRGYDNIISACKKTINALDCEYLDMYLIHWPASKAVHENWQEINEETWRAFEYLYQEGLVKSIGVCNFKKNQLEALLKTDCQENNILIEAWSPLGSGKMLKVEDLNNMAKKYNVSTANLCLKWCIQNKILPLPKSKNLERMQENINCLDFEISKEDMTILNEMPFVGGLALDSETITLFG